MGTNAHHEGPDRLLRGDRANRWRRADYGHDELVHALLAGRMAGPATSHDRENVRWKAHRLASGDPDGQFGLQGLGGVGFERVLEMMGQEAGFDPNPLLRHEPVPIDPERILASLDAAGGRLALAAERGERVVLATGHPVGLILLYIAVGELLEEHGAKLLRPMDGATWREDHHHREIRYLHGVAVLNDRASSIHTHRPDAMELMLSEATPDLVFADHGFAGAAIQAGVETVSIADINDPALVVAKHLGRTEVVIVMDDNVRPEDYWVCFQGIAARFPQ
jgi:Phosphatase